MQINDNLTYFYIPHGHVYACPPFWVIIIHHFTLLYMQFDFNAMQDEVNVKGLLWVKGKSVWCCVVLWE